MVAHSHPFLQLVPTDTSQMIVKQVNTPVPIGMVCVYVMMIVYDILYGH